MLLTAYNPATGKVKDRRLEIKEAANLVAGVAVRYIQNKRGQIKDLENQHASRLTDVRALRSAIRKERLLLDKLEQADPKKEFLALFKQQMKDSLAFRDGLIQDVRVLSGNIFITTSGLKFYKGQFVENYSDKLEKDLDIGHFLIRIAYDLINDRGLNSIEIINLDWRVGETGVYSHPNIDANRVCWGNTENEVRKLLNEGKIVELLDLLIQFLASPTQGNPYIGWDTYFEDRVSVKDIFDHGESYGQFSDDISLPPLMTRTVAEPKDINMVLYKYQGDHQPKIIDVFKKQPKDRTTLDNTALKAAIYAICHQELSGMRGLRSAIGQFIRDYDTVRYA